MDAREGRALCRSHAHAELAVAWMAHSPGAIRWKYRQMINALVYQAIVD